MEDIQSKVGGRLHSSRSVETAFRQLLHELDDKQRDGRYDDKDTERDIKIYGWSWGGISAVQLARRIKSDKKFSICRKTVKVVAVIDPDSTGITSFAKVPDNVKRLYNWYQTHGTGAPTPKDSHGGKLDIESLRRFVWKKGLETRVLVDWLCDGTPE